MTDSWKGKTVDVWLIDCEEIIYHECTLVSSGGAGVVIQAKGNGCWNLKDGKKRFLPFHIIDAIDLV